MANSMEEIMHPGAATAGRAAFPFAPPFWTQQTGEEAGRQADLKLTQQHWDVVRALQEYFARHQEGINVRELHDALEERFHNIGGMKKLYQMFPGGPVAQGCEIAGLEAPAGAADKSFGSVM